MTIQFKRKTSVLVEFLVIFILVLGTYSPVSTFPEGILQTGQSRISALDWSPDGTRIAVGRPNGIDILNVPDGGLIQSLTGSTSSVISVDWSPDGTKIAGASLDDVGVRIWSVSTGQIITTIQPTIACVSVRWSPDASKLAVTAFDTSVGIVSASTGQLLNAPPLSGAFIDWSPDGTKIVSGNGYENNLYIGDVTSGQQIMSIIGHSAPIEAVDWSPDGNKIVSGSDDYTVKVWNSTTGTLVLDLQGHAGLVTSVSWNPDSRLLVSSSSDGTIRFWDTQTGQSVGVISGINNPQIVEWSPDGNNIAYGGDDGIVRIVKPSNTGTGLRGQYFDNADVTTGFKFFRINSTVDFNWTTLSPDAAIAADTFSVRWTGKVEPLYSETYTFYVSANDGMRLWVNGQQIISDAVGWVNRTTEAEVASTPITLAAGVKYDIKLEYYENTGTAAVHLLWSSPRQAKQVIPKTQLYPPEGQLAFNGETSGIGEIFVINPDGSGEQAISGSTGNDYQPIWSPDGTKVAFVSTRDGNEEIYMANTNGTCVYRLTNSTTYDGGMSWSPDGTKIVFASARTGSGDIYVLTVPTTCTGSVPAATRFTNSTADEGDPMWSPNGQKIVFTWVITGYGQEIYIMPATALATPTRITTHGGYDVAPFWSPDGSKIAWRAPNEATDQVWIANTTPPFNPRFVTSEGTNYFQSWSPDGSSILFQSTRTGMGEAFIMDANGDNERQLTTGGASYSVWSADARQVAFIRGWDIYLVNADGTNLRQFTTTSPRREKELVWWQPVQTK